MASQHTEQPAAVDTSFLARIATNIDSRRVFRIYFVLVAIYIYIPILSLIAFSFNSGGLTFPFVSATTKWYGVLLGNEQLISSVTRSLELAAVTMVISTILGTMTALAYRTNFRWKRTVLYLLLLGIIIPGVTFGIGVNIFLNQTIHLSKGLWLAVPVEVVWTLPFAVIILLAGFPRNLQENEQAAVVMGASRWTVFREIILPQIAPTVLGAAVFAFTLTLNESTRALLIVGQDNTMPIEIFSTVSATRATPELFALGTLTTVISTILLVIGGLLVHKGGN